jgi:hypothetical protein
MFYQSQNENGTYNTRCLDCLMSVATAIESTEELGRIESRHCCPEKALLRLLASRKTQVEEPCHLR